MSRVRPSEGSSGWLPPSATLDRTQLEASACSRPRRINLTLLVRLSSGKELCAHRRWCRTVEPRVP